MKHIAILLIRAYKIVISPHLGATCRFEPSCSRYGIEAFEKHGFIRGLWLTARRLLRCHPFGAVGHDPVPLKWSGFFKKNRA
jgi:putative membrane protein insertion efficiency factor